MENIVRMARGFNKQCIAYGVDSKEDYEFAKTLGVDYLQGTYLSLIHILSEVAARFTLDAMPGKQMAIDADLSSGLITEEQAKILSLIHI